VEHYHCLTSPIFIPTFFAKFMKRLLAMSCSGILLLGAFAAPATAKSSQCNMTLQSVKSQLTNVKKFKTTKLISSGEPRPQGRSLQLNITLDLDSDNVMNNYKMQLAMAKKVIASCPQIVLVVFGQDQTDWAEMYGLVNGTVQAFDCKGTEEKVKWGEYICP
jgi:hypothetical protein